MTVATPLCRLRARLFEHPAADLHDVAGLLEHGHDDLGWDEPALGMLPSEQRLDAGETGVAQVEDRLVGEEELIGGECETKIGLEPDAVLHLRLHVGMEEHERALPLRLGAVEGDVGVAQQVACRRAVSRRDADACRDRQGSVVEAVEHDWFAQRTEQTLGDDIGTLVDRLALDEHDEFVAAEAPDGVALA